MNHESDHKRLTDSLITVYWQWNIFVAMIRKFFFHKQFSWNSFYTVEYIVVRKFFSLQFVNQIIAVFVYEKPISKEHCFHVFVSYSLGVILPFSNFFDSTNFTLNFSNGSTRTKTKGTINSSITMDT